MKGLRVQGLAWAAFSKILPTKKKKSKNVCLEWKRWQFGNVWGNNLSVQTAWLLEGSSSQEGLGKRSQACWRRWGRFTHHVSVTSPFPSRFVFYSCELRGGYRASRTWYPAFTSSHLILKEARRLPSSAHGHRAPTCADCNQIFGGWKKVISRT